MRTKRLLAGASEMKVRDKQRAEPKVAFQVEPFRPEEVIVTRKGCAYYLVPQIYDGWTIEDIEAAVITEGSDAVIIDAENMTQNKKVLGRRSVINGGSRNGSRVEISVNAKTVRGGELIRFDVRVIDGVESIIKAPKGLLITVTLGR